jgi:hypothetical protein
MDWWYALLALAAVALPLAVVGWLLGWQQRRRGRARMPRSPRSR